MSTTKRGCMGAGERKAKIFMSGMLLLTVLFAVNRLADGADAITLSPNSLVFAAQPVGAPGATMTVTVTNTTLRTMQIVGISTTGAPFSYEGISVPAIILARQSLKVSVTFNPTVAQAYTGRLILTVSNGTKSTVTLSGTGLPPVPVIPPAVAPLITTQPANQTITAGQTATFLASATGTAPFAYQWMRNGAAISGATLSSYMTPVTTTADSGAAFSIKVSNTGGSATSNSAVLTVSAPIVAPLITTQPTSLTVPAGQTASFSVAASGTNPLSYQWMKNGAAISGANSSSYMTAASTSADNGAQFTVTVNNSVGGATSNAATLNVSAAAPCVTSSGTTWTNTAVAMQGGRFAANFDATPAQANMDGVVGFSLGGATGYTSLAAIARFADSGMIDVMNGPSYGADVAMAYVAGRSYHFRFDVDPTSHIYSVYVTATGAGEVLLANNYGFRSAQSATSTLNNWGMVADPGAQTVCNMAVTSTPTVPTAPLITTQPTGPTVVAGQTATFSTVVSGTPPLSYAWRRSGTAIAGATLATYSISATTADSGVLFSVIVSNSIGSITSNSATLTVNAASMTLAASPLSLNFGTVNTGSSKTLSATITNSGNSNVTISNVSVFGAGFIASGISAGQSIAAGQSAVLNGTLTPSSTGSLTGTATITSNASPITIVLAGSGATLVSRSVSLSWGASSSTVIGYNVYSSAIAGGPYSRMNASPITPTSYTDSSVRSGTTYYYTVTSVNSANSESVYSNEVASIVP